MNIFNDFKPDGIHEDPYYPQVENPNVQQFDNYNIYSFAEYSVNRVSHTQPFLAWQRFDIEPITVDFRLLVDRYHSDE